ncbi:MAG: PEP-CTERM sorting domain-containing protein [Burkholderiales bacterium]
MLAGKLAVSAALAFSALLPWQAQAATFDFSFAGPGVSGSISLTYGAATDAKYPQAFEVTEISGTFSDSNHGLNIVNAAVGPLIPITRDTPEAANLLAPNDFSRFAVATGLDPINNGFLTYDNLLYPNGSPQTASDYPLHGGKFDIYGLMFSIGNGRVVNLWSNGDITGSGVGAIYGVAVATSAEALDYVGGVSAVPEPGTVGMVAGGLLLVGAFAARRKHGQ